MTKFLVHIHTGPESPSKSVFGCQVAATAIRQGHTVSVFLAGNAVTLLSYHTIESLGGTATGKLSDHISAIEQGGGRFYLSSISAKTRGMTESVLDGRPVEFAMPDALVRLAAEADTVLCY